MYALTRLVSTLLGRPATSRQSRGRRPARSYRPRLEALEDRSVPSGLSAPTGLLSVTTNFTGNAIPANDYLWFRSSARVQGITSDPVTLNFTNQSIDFTANGTHYDLSVPDASVTLSSSETTGTTTFDGTSWTTTAPTQFTGRVFVSGFALALPNGLPGGVKSVTWSAQVSSDTAGLKVNWEWAASAYRKFNSDMSELGVQALDDQQPMGHRFYPAGMPDNYAKFVVKGATDGMRAHDPHHFWVTVPALQPATVSGSILDLGSNTGLQGISLNLTGVDSSGNSVSLWTDTAPDGTYQFVGLAAGTYTITEQTPGGLIDSQNTAGTVGGTAGSGQISGITLTWGTNATGYVFGDNFSSDG